MTLRNGVAFALATVLLSCTTKNDASVEIAAMCGFPDDAALCKFTAECETWLMDRPWVSTRVSTLAVNDSINYLALPIEIMNRMKANDDESLFRVNTNDFTIEEFRLSFTSSPAIALASQVHKHNQLVPAEGTTVAMVTLIPERTMAAIDAENLPTSWNSWDAPNVRVDVAVQAYGHTRDGQTITTEPWVVPVDVYDVDRPNRTFDPVCVTTSGSVPASAVCPKGGQTARIGCSG